MKASDFERAIDALNCSIEIDEMRMKADSGGHVRLVKGHTEHNVLLWDETGRSFRAERAEDALDIAMNVERDARYDLRFD